MASVTYFVVLPFVRDVDGGLVAEEAKEAPSGYAAMARARAMVGVKAGAIVFARTGDPALGDFDDAVILGRYGEVPFDLDVFTGAGARTLPIRTARPQLAVTSAAPFS